MKILHIFGQMERGGAELRTIEIMRHLDSNNFSLHFCVLSGLPGELDETIRSLNGKVHYIRLYSLQFPWRFYQLLKQEHYDIVHSHVHYPSGFILFLAALAGVPGRITHFRSSHDGQGNSFRRRIQRRALKVFINQFSTSILAVSETAMVSAWENDWHSDPRCQVIYNGIDPDLFISNCSDIPENLGLKNREWSNLYIHVGRFDAAKNHQRLLAIFAMVAQIDLKAHLLLVGQGDNELEQIAREFVEVECLQERITFAGNRDDVPRLLSAADIMIFPSKWEGLPGAVLEACAAGKPVLASDIPVILEIAKYLPQIHYLPLETPDIVWANEAQKYCLNGKQPAIRYQAKLAFGESPFTIQSAVRLQKAIWKGT